MKLQKGKIVNLVQGSPEWDALRARRKTASEAAAAQGKHKYMSRNDLMKQKATGIVPEVDRHQQRIFDDGHKAEAEARPIAESLIEDELYPVVLDDEEGGFLASMDGLTMSRKIGFEHKWLSADLERQIDAGQLDEHYLIQMDQQFALSGAERILFVGSDGTEENFKYLWIERDESRFKAIEASWQQFADDLAEYKSPVPEPGKAEGKAPDALPALSVQVQGMVTASNLKQFEGSARATLANINTDLQTDNDFADAEQAVKFCKDVEKRLDSAKDNVLGQMQTVDEVVRSIESIKEETRQIRLKLDKAVKDQKEARKLEILGRSNDLLQKHLCNLENDLEKQAGGDFSFPLSYAIKGDFSGAMKGKKTITSLQSACDDELARAKIEANEIAGIIRTNLQQMNEHAADHKFLFRDFGQICQKPAEDFAAVVKQRIVEHREAEQKRLDAEREKIRQEEQSMVAREVPAKTATPVAQEPAAKPEVVQQIPPTQNRATRPTDDQIIGTLAECFRVHESVVLGWLVDMDLDQAGERLASNF